jgi:hypothetical protein
MGSEVSLPYSQGSATGPCLEPHDSSQHPSIRFLRPNLSLSAHLRLGLPSGLYYSSSSTKCLYAYVISLMRPTFHVHLILDLLTIIIFDEEHNINISHKTKSSCFCDETDSMQESLVSTEAVLLFPSKTALYVSRFVSRNKLQCPRGSRSYSEGYQHLSLSRKRAGRQKLQKLR